MKSFVYTLVVTLCLLMLAGGLLWADVRTRAVTFDDSTPPYAQRTETTAELPLPATGEVLRRLYRGEKIVLEYLIEKLQNIT